MMARNIEDTYGLSAIQQGMLFHSLDSRQSGVDIEQLVCTLHEDLNVPAFRQAWDCVIDRHPALRTSFRWEHVDEAVQEVHRSVVVPFQEDNWQALSASEQKIQLEVFLQSDRKRGFELGSAPLMRLALFRVAEADYQFVWSFHHILADGRSHFLILNEVFGFYEAFCRSASFRPEPARPYGDYIRWLQQQDLPKSRCRHR
jgi:NRPS condensation-like uncharacterized protein